MALAQQTEPRMNAQAFMDWREAQAEGVRYELYDGRVYEMSAERLIHVRMKSRIHRQFERQIADRRLPCEALPDGMAVRVDEDTVFEPDALVRCGPSLPDETILILDPLIVVEVASPSSQRIDALDKFARYFNNSSIVHYLIIVPTKRIVIHHTRADDGRIVGRSYIDTGIVRLEPPGLELSLVELFGNDQSISPAADDAV
jgi:Uma2 family endonuclease